MFGFFSFFASAQKEFLVRGTLQNVEDGTVFILMKEQGNVGVGVASDTLRNGQFRLKWKTVSDGTETFFLLPKSKGNGFPSMFLTIWVGSSSLIEVTGNDKWIYTWDVKNDVPEQMEQSWFLNPNRADWNEYQYLTVKYDNLPKESLKTSEGKILADSLSRFIQRIRKKIVLNEIELLKQRPIETAAGMVVLEGAVSVMEEERDTSKLSEFKCLYNQLNKAQKESREGNYIHTILYPSKVLKEGV